MIVRYVRKDKISQAQTGLEADAVEAAEQGLVAEKNMEKFFINNVNTRTNSLALQILTSRSFEDTRVKMHAFERIQTLNSWSYPD